MQEYFELRNQLADFYSTSTDWRRVAHESDIDAKQIVLEGKPITVWTDILAAVRTQQRMSEFRALLERENSELLPVLDAYGAALGSRGPSSVQISKSTTLKTKGGGDAITQFCRDVASRIKHKFRALKMSPHARPDKSAPGERFFYIIEPNSGFNTAAVSDGDLYPLSYEINFKTEALDDGAAFEVALVWNADCDKKLFGVFLHERRLETYVEALKEPLTKLLPTDFINIGERGNLQIGFRRRLSWSAEGSSLQDAADDLYGSESAAEDIINLKQYCEKLLGETIRNCIKVINDPTAKNPFSVKTAKSISIYLRHRSYAKARVFVVDDDVIAANKQFGDACQKIWDDQHLYLLFFEVLGANFGLYALAPAINPTDGKQRFLFYSMKEARRHDDLLLRMFGERGKDQKKRDKTAQTQGDANKFVEGSFGHWLLSYEVSPTPLAVVLHYSPAFDETLPAWKARAFIVYDNPLGFAISASRKDNTPAIAQKLRDSMGLQGIEERLDAIRTQLVKTPKGHYMRDIKSVLFIPIAGNPGVTFQILSRKRILVGGKVEFSDPETFCVSYDELFAMRLGAESFKEEIVQYYGDLKGLGEA